jgi:DNA-binding NarL/FixJ family response regulator
VSTRMLLAEGHPLILAGLEHTLAGLPGFEVVATTTRGSEVVLLVEHHDPEVLLLDLRLPAVDVLSVVEQLQVQLESLRIVAFADAADRARVDEALRAGACGFVPKRTPPQELASVLLRAMKGEQLDDLLLDAIGVPKGILTTRESEIAGRAAAGETNKEIAKGLLLSETTVKFHLTNIHRKLGTTSREELVHATRRITYATEVKAGRRVREHDRGRRDCCVEDR